jgi:hypothetical protein
LCSGERRRMTLSGSWWTNRVSYVGGRLVGQGRRSREADESFYLKLRASRRITSSGTVCMGRVSEVDSATAGGSAERMRGCWLVWQLLLISHGAL